VERVRKAEYLTRDSIVLELGKSRVALPKNYTSEKSFPRLDRSLGNDRGTDRNRRVSSSLSPIFYLFLAPSGKLYLKMQHLLVGDKLFQRSNPPLIQHRRPGPKHPKLGIPTELWSTVVQRVVEQKEPLRSVAAAYGVSHETIRRIMLHGQQAVWTARSLASSCRVPKTDA
jgi:hypothetical protein